MRIIVDIDNTICTQRPKGDYENAEPMMDRIEMINDLYDQGNEIVYWTSRGSRSGIDWYAMTENQLIQWGCKFTTLNLSKPHYDLWIDDKAYWPFTN